MTVYIVHGPIRYMKLSQFFAETSGRMESALTLSLFSVFSVPFS